MSSPPPAPAQTQTTQVSKMSPEQWTALYGDPNAPGAQVLRNSSQLANMMEGVQKGDPTAMANFYGAPQGTTDFSAYNPNTLPLPADRPMQQSTPQQAAMNERLAAGQPGANVNVPVYQGEPQRAATGGEIRGFPTGGNVTPKSYDTIGSTQGAPYSQAQAMFNGFNYNYDPRTGQTTNPYYNQAIGTLERMNTMPGQYGQAGEAFGKAGEGLAGAAGYKPEQISGATMQGPQAWNTQQAQNYMDPYINTALKSQMQLMENTQFAPQRQQLQSQETANKAFGGARGAIAEQQQRLGQDMMANNVLQQGLSNAYQQGMGQFNTWQGMNQAANQANAGWQQQANMANQQAGLQGNQQNIGAWSQLGNIGQGLGGLGNNIAGYGNQMFQNWGSAGNTLQNIGQQYYQNQQQNAQNLWGGVTNAAAPGVNALTNNPIGQTKTGTTTNTPSSI